jgi:phenylacetate-CoA ligase
VKGAFDLSVVVPCFNEEANLGNLVERIRETMTMANIATEIVLVDDCSRDRTRQIIEELSRQHPFVLGVFHERNQGIASGWRSGLEASHGPAIAIMDADLQYAPEEGRRP